MIALTIVACSILHDGGRCKSVELVFQDVSLLTCVMSGLPQVAAWSEAHPNWRVAKWSCGEAGRLANI